MSWTDERVDELKRLWADGLSASQIAARLGGVTRNAVIGKVHRLGLSGRGAPTRVTRRRPVAPRPPRVSTASSQAPRERAAPRVVEPEPVAEELEIVTNPDNHATVLELNEQTCKWPIGDPGQEGFHFCGSRSAPGLPYCAAHAKKAYQPLPSRRERKERQQQRMFQNRLTG